MSYVAPITSHCVISGQVYVNVSMFKEWVTLFTFTSEQTVFFMPWIKFVNRNMIIVTLQLWCKFVFSIWSFSPVEIPEDNTSRLCWKSPMFKTWLGGYNRL